MRYLITLLIGVLIGAAATVFFLGSVRLRSAPGTRVLAPEPSGDPPGTVTVGLSNSFLNEILGTVFRDLDPPAFQLSTSTPGTEEVSFTRAAFQQGCKNSVTLAQEGSNVKTHVQFANSKITAPMAFSGSYNLLGNCMQFKGWADTTIDLRFDQEKQIVYGQVNVEGVNLEGVNPIANNFVTLFVRNAIDQRVNPLELIRAPQLQLMIPVKASNGTVKAQVKDVRAEILDGSLKMHITYEFDGRRG
ncbi:MAG TPA: hypothetical protein VJ124_06855 [Pyrinomonadaceae bacterium]|nr:hypothetical protein [Pyrinomonadaceae bacterium]